MAEFKAIKGQAIKNRTSDPLVAGTANGTWGSGTDMNTARGRMGVASSATSTTHSAYVYGGNTPGGPAKTVNTEQYDGTSWTEQANVNVGRAALCGGGTLTSAIYAGGEVVNSPYNTDAHEQWDGSSWSESTEINTARRGNLGFGATATAALTVGGYVSASSKLTEEWNGSSWTEKGDQNAAKYGRGGTGTVTDGIIFGGNDPSTNTETWNGSSWTEVSELNTAGEYRAASGTATEVIAAGSYPSSANVELWNGTAWTEINNISTARWEGGGTGNVSLGIIAGGHPGTNVVTTTEEFSAATITDSIVTEGQVYYRTDTGDMKVTLTDYGTGAWSSGTNLPSTRNAAVALGSQNEALIVGGQTAPGGKQTLNTEYDGSSWTELADITTASSHLSASNGTTTSSIIFGRETATGPTFLTGNTESWNGSSWSEVADLNTTEQQLQDLELQLHHY